MPTSAGSVFMDLRLNKNTFQSDVNSLGSFTKGVFTGMAQAAAAAFSVYALTKFISSSVDLASKLNEVQNVVDVTFGDSKEKINAFAKSAVSSFGLSEYAAKQYTGTMGAMLKSMGFTAPAAAGMSIEMAKLTGDMASFYNLSTDEAFAKIRAGISGEMEPLKQLGINLSVANLNAYALSKGLGATYDSMSQSNQSLLRYNYLLSITSDAQGDFARTSGGWANQVRVLKLNWESFMSTVGQGFIMLFTPIVQGINLIMPKLIQMGQAFSNFISMVTGQKLNTTSVTSGLADVSAGATEMAATAAKSAASAKRSLMGFDEINVLKKSSSSGSAGGASLTPALSTTTSSITEAAGSVPATGLGAGLLWFYNNVLVPIGSWTGNQLVPAFLNAISGVIAFMTPIILGFKPMAEWLWNTFLVPLATWTGGVVVASLNGVGDALKSIGGWMSENQGTVDTMVTSFAIFFGLWKLTEMMAFIQMSGGLAAAFALITTSVLTSTGSFIGHTWAMISDKAVSMAIIGLYAIDFLNSIVSGTAALLAQTGQWIASTAVKGTALIATGVLTAGQWLLNGALTVGTVTATAFGAAVAFITSPIGIAIAAVAAMIAIGVLLWRNWDSVSAFAGNLWNNVKNIFGQIGSFVGGIWNGIVNGFIDVVNTVISGVNTMIKGFLSPFNKLIEGWNNGIGKIAGKIPTINISIPTIPRFAGGGVIDSPTLGLMGEYSNAKRNPEIVTPQSIMYETFMAALDAHDKGSSDSGRSVTIQNILDGEILEELILNLQTMKLQRSNGRSAG